MRGETMNMKRIFWSFIQFVIVVFLAIFIVLDVLAIQYANLITVTLGQESYKEVETSDEEQQDTMYFNTSYTSYDELLADEENFARRVQGEGTVLLKNDAGLPIEKSAKITLLGAGVAQTNSANTGFLASGGGSGAIDISKIPSLYQVFTDAGYDVNRISWNYYNDGDGHGTRNYASGIVGETDPSAIPAEVRESFENYGDVGIIVIGRTGAESVDLPFKQWGESSGQDKSYLELSDNEEALIELAVQTFDQTVVLLNTMSAFDCSAIEDEDVSVLWVGAGGQRGLLELPNILDGTTNPSGRTVDTFAANLEYAPATVNQGNFAWANTTESTYYVYAEGIYVGYRYYETRYEDAVLGRGNATAAKGTPNSVWNYEDEVLYPFGYGLSYTTFEYSDFSLKTTAESEYIDVSVTVHNTGAVAGKEVVQIYMQSPYTVGGLEKSAVELVGFTKTDLLERGAEQTVTITIPKEYMRSWDPTYNGGQGAYVVEEGSYYFGIGKNAHDALNNILLAKDASLAVEGDSAFVGTVEQEEDSTKYSVGADGQPIVNRFAKADITYYDPNFEYLSREDWDGTFPVPYGGSATGGATASEELIADMAIPVVPEDPNAIMPTVGKDSELPLVSLMEVAYDSNYWNDILDQLTLEEMWTFIGTSGKQTIALPSIAKPGTIDQDGPAGFTSALAGGASGFGYFTETLLSSTWNKQLATEMGGFIGEDSLVTGTSGWYAPSANIHRSAFSGRNFEYYSEDGYLSGVFASNVIKAASEKGVYCYMKHFALNDQETNRASACTFSNEQAIREIYLRPFEIAVRDGGANAMMSSYNRIGATYARFSRELLTDVLRNEWGFLGMVITDLTSPGNEEEMLAALYAGNDLWLNTGTTVPEFTHADNATIVSLLRDTMHRSLYVIGNSNAMNGISTTMDIVLVTPPWVYWLIALNVVVVAGLGIASFFTVRRAVRARSEGDTVGIASKAVMIDLATIAFTVLGAVLGAVGAFALSAAVGIGLNLALSPVTYVGAAMSLIGLAGSIVTLNVYNKKGIRSKWAYIAVIIAIIAVIIVAISITLAITLPVLMPSNG